MQIIVFVVAFFGMRTFFRWLSSEIQKVKDDKEKVEVLLRMALCAGILLGMILGFLPSL